MSETEEQSGATFCATELDKMLRMQLERVYDYQRMHRFWLRVLEGETPAKDIATALCMVLSSGRYVKAPESPRNIFNVTVTVESNAAPEQIAEAVQASLARCLPRR